MSISVADPVGRSMTRAIDMTFRPFRLARWFTIGFIAWIATLSDSGSNFNFNFPGGGGRRPAPAPVPAPWPPTAGGTPTTAPTPDQQVWNWMTANPGLAIAIVSAGAAVILATVLLAAWLSSRGRFMLLHAIANDSDEVRGPWRELRATANSLFAFRAGLLFAWLVVFITVLGAVGWIAWPDVRAHTFGKGAAIATAAGLAMFLPCALALALIAWATDSFVTVIMYARGCGVVDGWQEFRRDVLRGNVGQFVLFLLMHILLGIAVVIGQVIIGFVTCCIGFLPYLSTVFTLPLVLFLACYPIYFMQQFGPQYTIIKETPAVPAGGFPVVGVNFPPPTQPPSDARDSN